MSQLDREQTFHDRWAQETPAAETNVDVAFEGSTAPENRFILSRLGDVKGKYILDLGCGFGEGAVYFAGKGARCVAADLSPDMLASVRRLAELRGVRVETRTVDVENIDFPADTFDVVYAANVLHHASPERGIAEIHRILKRGGTACTWDPLRHNPVIKIYRRMASGVRTEDERPLHIRFVRTVRSLFSETEYRTFWIATLWIFLRFYLIERVHPGSERYWKKILTDEPRLRRTHNRLEKIDNVLTRIPGVRRLAWNIAIVARK